MMNIKFRGGLLGLKRLHGFLEVTAAQCIGPREIEFVGPVGKGVGEVVVGCSWATVGMVKQMAAAAQNTNNMTINSKASTLLPYLVASQAARDAYEALYDAQNKVACLMLGSMSPELQRTLENYKAYDMIQELKNYEDGQSVSSYLLKMKSYLDTLERLGYAMPNELGVSLILNSLNKDYDQFVQNYNMHSMGKTLAELHAMLKLHEKGILKKAETPTVLAIREGKIQKDKKKLLAKDSICHHYKEVGHWRRNCLSCHAELKKRKNVSEASNSGIFTIELCAISNNAWVYDTGMDKSRNHSPKASEHRNENQKSSKEAQDLKP
ncbi:hypothetical protein Tco_0436158 [Tanacetum coccineum]